MASINGVEIKGIKKSQDHEGMDIFQGNIYIDGKKAGFWSQDYCGGCGRFDFATAVLSKRAKDFQNGFPKNYKYYPILADIDVFVGKIVELIEEEKVFKKMQKKGHTIACSISDGFHYSCFATSDPVEMTNEEFEKKYKKNLDNAKASMFKDGYSVRFYRSLDDFNLKIDAEHSAPDWLIRA